MTENIKDLLPFYALDALTDAERVQVEAWLTEHPEARAELDEMTHTSNQLVESIEPIVPSSQVKSALMDRIASDARVSKATVAPQPKTSQQSLSQWLNNLFQKPAFGMAGWACAAVAIMFAILTVTNTRSLQGDIEQLNVEIAEKELAIGELTQQQDVSAIQLTQQAGQLAERDATIAVLEDRLTTLERTNDALRDQIAADEEVLAIFTAPNWQTAPIKAIDEDNGAAGHLVVDLDEEQAVLSVSDLAPLPADQTYQLWFLGEDGPESAGTFTIDPEGEVLHTFPLTSTDPYSAMGISIEPLGGSPQPTGTVVMRNPDL